MNSSFPKRIDYFPSWAEDVMGDVVSEPAPEITQDPNCFNILFAGNIGEAQDFPAIVRAAEILKDQLAVRWIIVGNGRKMEWLKSEVARLNLGRIFIFPGRFSVDRMPSIYAHADALLISLRADPVFALTIPGKLQSCLMTGIPLLGMLDGEAARVIQESGAGLVCRSGDSEEFALHVRSLAFKSKVERIEMGRCGQKFGAAAFGRNMLLNRLEGWMESLSQCR